MKKAILFIALVTGTIFQSQAQENVSIGPMVGLSVANLRGDISNNDWKTGATVGGFLNFSSESGFGFSGQLLFTQLGAKVSNKTNEVNLNYLQVPLLLTYYMGRRGDAFRPKLFIGPNVGLMLSAKDKNGVDISGDDNNPTYRPLDLGATAGIGFNYRIDPKVWLNFDVRYGLGLVDIARTNATELYNQNVGINLGVSFPFGTYNPRTGNLNTR